MKANCEYCINYEYDEDFEYYVCTMDLDEDEMRRFVCGRQQHEVQQTDRRQRENSLRHAACPLSDLVYGVL